MGDCVSCGEPTECERDYPCNCRKCNGESNLELAKVGRRFVKDPKRSKYDRMVYKTPKEEAEVNFND